jgi:putative copper resistance protein D
MREATEKAQFVSGTTNDPTDIAWSEYNHHWAGLIVLLCGGLALLAHGGVRWARHWPLAFMALAFFIVLRADSETSNSANKRCSGRPGASFVRAVARRLRRI